MLRAKPHRVKLKAVVTVPSHARARRVPVSTETKAGRLPPIPAASTIPVATLPVAAPKAVMAMASCPGMTRRATAFW